jgi:hypothetical protein
LGSNLKHLFDVFAILFEEVRSALGVPAIVILVQGLGELDLSHNLEGFLVGIVSCPVG